MSYSAQDRSKRWKNEEMTREELDTNWEKMKAQLADLTEEGLENYVDEGGLMIGLIERLVAEGKDLKMWSPKDEDMTSNGKDA